MFAIANGNVLPCHVTSILAPERVCERTVRTNDAIRSGNVHSVVLKKTRTNGGRNAITSRSRPGDPVAAH